MRAASCHRLPYEKTFIKNPSEIIPKFVRILLACLICLAVAGGLNWLIQRLSA
jgi:hypothetical protein